MAHRVLIVDDVPSFREIQRIVFEMEDDFDVVGEAVDGEDAIAKAAALAPDVVVLDWEMPRLDGVAALPRLRAACPGLGVVMFTSSGASEAAAAAGDVGAAVEFFDKSASIEAVVDAARRVARAARSTHEVGGARAGDLGRRSPAERTG